MKIKVTDKLGNKLHLGNLVAFAKTTILNDKTKKKGAILLIGKIIEIVKKFDGAQSIKILDPVTEKVSHIRNLQNVILLEERAREG